MHGGATASAAGADGLKQRVNTDSGVAWTRFPDSERNNDGFRDVSDGGCVGSRKY